MTNGIINKYNISITEEYIDFIKKSTHYFDKINPTYLLKTKNDEFNILEKVVYDIALYQLSQLDIEFDPNIHYIEFGVHKKGDQIFKINTSMSKGNPITPFFSSIIYLTENNKDFKDNMVFTNIDSEKYMYKEFGEDTSFYISFPKKCQQIIFDGSIYYYASNLLNNITLSVNIWNIFPNRITYFDTIIFNYVMYNETRDEIFNDSINIIARMTDSIVAYQKDEQSIPVIGTSDIITDDFLEKMIYEKVVHDDNNTIYEKLVNLITDKTPITIFKRIINTNVSPSVPIANTINRINIAESKFIQRGIIRNKYQTGVCNWIITEAERYAINVENWKEDNNLKIVQIENIPSIFSFILDSFNQTVDSICELYSIKKDDHVFEIENIFIQKLELINNNDNDTIELFYDSHEYDIISNIVLNDDFEGGGKIFEDDITSCLHKGDMIIYNGNTKSKELHITNGLKYILVSYINISKKQ